MRGTDRKQKQDGKKIRKKVQGKNGRRGENRRNEDGDEVKGF